MEIKAGLVAIAVHPPPGPNRPNFFTEMVQFYRQLLQQDPEPYQVDRYAEFQLPGLWIALFPPKPSQQLEFGQASNSPISLCLKITDLAEAIAQLKTWDCPMGEVAIASHGQEVYAYDPQGNRIILYQPNSSRGMANHR